MLSICKIKALKNTPSVQSIAWSYKFFGHDSIANAHVVEIIPSLASPYIKTLYAPMAQFIRCLACHTRNYFHLGCRGEKKKIYHAVWQYHAHIVSMELSLVDMCHMDIAL